MRRFARYSLTALLLVATSQLSPAANDVAVPGSCTPEVNRKLGELLNSGATGHVDNVMVCGTSVSSSHPQRGGPHGSHEIIPLQVTFPDHQERLIEIVINDELDGRVTAPNRASVFAYGQAFFPTRGRFTAGIHDVHCATHRGADNGWVVVNGEKHPDHC